MIYLQLKMTVYELIITFTYAPPPHPISEFLDPPREVHIHVLCCISLKNTCLKIIPADIRRYWVPRWRIYPETCVLSTRIIGATNYLHLHILAIPLIPTTNICCQARQNPRGSIIEENAFNFGSTSSHHRKQLSYFLSLASSQMFLQPRINSSRGFCVTYSSIYTELSERSLFVARHLPTSNHLIC
jgi:hypothetical protein